MTSVSCDALIRFEVLHRADIRHFYGSNGELQLLTCGVKEARISAIGSGFFIVQRSLINHSFITFQSQIFDD